MSTYIHPSSFIGDNVTIEDNVYIGAFCIIGSFPEKIGSEHKDAGVVIKSGTKINGLVSIDSGAERPTIIGNDCFIMKHCHIGHDCEIGDNVVLAPGVVIGGHCEVDDAVGFGINSSVHQRVIIESGCFFGMGSVVPRGWKGHKNRKYVGVPVRDIGENIRK